MIDLDDGSPLQALPSSQTHAQCQPRSPPTSAELHLLAASVTNSAQTNTEIRTAEHADELLGTEIFIFKNEFVYLLCKVPK